MATITETDTAEIAQGLAEGRISNWDTHKLCPLTDWQTEVENDYTRLGYWDWVIGKLDAGDFEEPTA